MVPTIENTRAFGINQEERPVLGGNYSQFTLRYDIPKDSDDGVWAGARSITTHVFYVKSNLASAFKAEIIKAFPDVEAVTDSPAGNFESNPGGAVGSNNPAPVTP